MSFVHYMFFPHGQPWYTGAVWSNVLQAVLFLVPSVLLVVRKMRRHHRELERRMDERHRDLIARIEDRDTKAKASELRVVEELRRNARPANQPETRNAFLGRLEAEIAKRRKQDPDSST